LDKIADVVAVKAAELAPAGTDTEGGTARTVVVSLRATIAPRAGAALERVSLQDAFAFAGRLVGVHDSAETRIGAIRAMDVFAEEPLRDAVMVAV
jgi:hypothetical protein